MTISATDFLTLREVQDLTKLSKSSIYRLSASGGFPRPFRWGERAVRWNRAEVEEWMRSRPRTEISA